MRIIDTPQAILRMQYRIIRFPFQLLEERVITRMGSEAPARLFYERSVGLLDAAVGNALGDYRLAKRGSALAARSDALHRASQLDANADQARQQSSADLKAKSNKAIDHQQDARAVKERAVQQARHSAEERKRAADQAAARRTAAANKKADDVATQRRSAAEAAKQGAQARIRRNEQQAAAASKSKLDDAQARRTEAGNKRMHADKLEELGGVEKRKRQSERAE